MRRRKWSLLKPGTRYHCTYSRKGHGKPISFTGTYAGEAAGFLVFHVEGSGFWRWRVLAELFIEAEQVPAYQRAVAS